MTSYRLSRLSNLLLAVLAMFAFGAVITSAAQAVEAPRWSVAGKTLATEAETHHITAKAYSSALTVRAGNITVSCKTVKLAEGEITGSSAGNAGKGKAVSDFSGCTVSGKAGGKSIEKCKVPEPIVSNPVKAELVESEKAEPANRKGSLLVLFEPVTGTTFATLKFTTEAGGNCPPETKVTGKVATQVFTDPNKPPELGTLVSLESGATEATSWLLNFPGPAVRKVTRISGGVTSEISVKLELFSEEAALEGTALILLANAKGESEETAKWSPLP